MANDRVIERYRDVAKKVEMKKQQQLKEECVDLPRQIKLRGGEYVWQERVPDDLRQFADEGIRAGAFYTQYLGLYPDNTTPFGLITRAAEEQGKFEVYLADLRIKRDGRDVHRALKAGNLSRKKGGKLVPAGMPGRSLYLITNPSQPGWIKVGYTDQKAERRVKQLQCGAVSDLVVAKEYQLPPEMTDAEFHPLVEAVAGARNREWFFLPLDMAMEVVEAKLRGEEHVITGMGRAEPPSVLATVRTSFADVLKTFKRKPVTEPYPLDVLALS